MVKFRKDKWLKDWPYKTYKQFIETEVNIDYDDVGIIGDIFWRLAYLGGSIGRFLFIPFYIFK